MSNYLLFSGSDYYPCGGWEDFISAHETLEEAHKAGLALYEPDWWHVVDTTIMHIVDSITGEPIE